MGSVQELHKLSVHACFGLLCILLFNPQRYQKKSQLEHILLRPDSYIGSTEINTQQLWVMPQGESRMQLRTVSFAPGLYKIVDEILVNAADVKARETEGNAANIKHKMNAIKVDIDEEKGSIRVWNDGEGKHREKIRVYRHLIKP